MGFIPSPGLDYGSNKFCLAVLGWAYGRRGALGAGRVRSRRAVKDIPEGKESKAEVTR